jgi:hypothetical protein
VGKRKLQKFREVKKLTHASFEKKKSQKAGLFVVRCDCGAEILMLPDAKLMGKAIESHVDLHRWKMKKPDEVEIERLRDCLIAQVLEKANQSSK